MHVDWRPVLDGTRIKVRRVLVGPKWPRGLWRFDDIELAELIDSGRREWSTRQTAARLDVDVSQVRKAVQWLATQRAMQASDETTRVDVHVSGE